MVFLLSARKPAQLAALVISLMPIGFGCADRVVPVERNFSLRYGDLPISCTEAAAGLLLTDLRFYLYDVELTDQGGRSRTLELLPDGQWQDGKIALLDFEDGQGACINGSEQRNSSLRGKISGGPFRGITFTVGVPPDNNHRDPMTAQAPLNYTAMHWHWLSGYKFMRVGVSNESDNFWMHLGSSRCDGSINDGIECRSSNRVAVALGDFDPTRDRIVIDLEPLVAAVNLADGSGSDCSSGPDELACSAAFAALGLPFGATAAAASQRVFRSEPAP